MKKIILLLAACLFIFACNTTPQKPAEPVVNLTPWPEADAIAPANPFPHNLTYEGCIKPEVDQEEMNEKILEYFEYWEKAFIRQSNGVTPGGGYYVNMKGTGGGGNEITTSEAQGYGMLIYAMMAGKVENAKGMFDGIYNMCKQHPSKSSKYLMSWTIHKSERITKKYTSATDGDMDIAYALLIAHKQWGSDGEINYLQDALDIINKGIKKLNVSADSKWIMHGDWDRNMYSTRSSDWLGGHLMAFGKATGEEDFWSEVRDVTYDTAEAIQANYSPETGLMPDFIIDPDMKAAHAGYLEGPYDGMYYYNACRFPLRFAADVAETGSPRAKAILSKMMDWSTQAHPEILRLPPGFDLDGSPITTSYTSTTFQAPMLAGSIIDPAYQEYLNNGWKRVSKLSLRDNDYFGDSLTMLSLLLISGNWLAP